MAKELENLLPINLQQATIEYFGAQAVSIILLKQQAAGTGPILLDHPVARLLHPNETAQADGYKSEKRKSEFLTGRICAKLAVGEFLSAKGRSPAPSTVEIINASTGRPYVRSVTPSGTGNRPQPPEISITHGGGYGAAMATDTPCGIDIQEQKDTLLRVMDKYCTAEEYRLLQNCLPEMAPPARLSLLWAAKEAAKKALSYWRMPGFLDLVLTLPVLKPVDCIALPLTVRTPENCRPSHKVTVLATTFYHRYGLAVCVLQEARSYAGITRS